MIYDPNEQHEKKQIHGKGRVVDRQVQSYFLSLTRVYDTDLSAQCVEMLSMRYDR